MSSPFVAPIAITKTEFGLPILHLSLALWSNIFIC